MRFPVAQSAVFAAVVSAFACGLSLRASGAELRIDPGSIRSEAGSFRLQFEGPEAGTAMFEVLRAQRLGSPTRWDLEDRAVVVAIEAGRFEVVVPRGLEAQALFQIRYTGEPPARPAPVFNEVMADNLDSHASADGRYLDWIELFNPHDEAIELGGFILADEDRSGLSWRFPAQSLPARSHLLIYASDADPAPIPGSLVAPIGIRNGGETLLLLDEFERELDRVVVPPLGPNQAIGRTPDGSATWFRYNDPLATPGRENVPQSGGIVVAPPQILPSRSFHAGPFEIQVLAPTPGVTIHFTTNGSPASAASPRWEASRIVDRNSLLRAIAIDAQGNSSVEVVRTFFVGVRHETAIVSITSPPSHFDFTNGYLFGMGPRVLNSRGEVLQNYPFSGSNAWQDREAEVHMEFFEPDGTSGIRQHAGLKVYGGWGSRGYPQKSLALFARRRYGSGEFRHEFFPGLGVNSFESLVLRNSGNDNQSTHQIPPRAPITEFGSTKSYGSYFVNGTFTLLRDALMQELLAGETSLDRQAYRPVVLYVNGEYWGIYGLREKLTVHHIAAHHDLPRSAIDLIEGYGDVRAGDAVAYRVMRDLIASRPMSNESFYQQVASTYLDIDNFIDYQIAVLFFQNFDIGNIKAWRPRTPHGRFRWMVYDQDYGFGLWPASIYEPAMARDYADYLNMFAFATAGSGSSTAWPNAGGRTLLLRRLLENPGFRQRFVRRIHDLLNSAFREDRVIAHAKRLAAEIRPEIPAHLARWSWEHLRSLGYGAPYQPEFMPFVPATWESNLVVLHEFAQRRPSNFRTQAAAHFRFNPETGGLRLASQPPAAGRIRVNSLFVDTPWEGLYPAAITNYLLPVARPGFHFRGWTTPRGAFAPPGLTWNVGPGETHLLTAEFQPADPGARPATQLWISEINYHSPDSLDADDWIELHNPNPFAVDLDGWVLRDQQDEVACVLPSHLVPPGSFAVVARSIPKFQWAHPGGPDPVTSLTLALSNGGDVVRLYDPRGIEVERVPYLDESPWPADADGRGSTLVRVMPPTDPRAPAAWRASPLPGGTPGNP